MATVIDGRESGFKTNPDYKITFEASPRRVRVKFNGETIADSTRAHLLFETRHLPVYYFPRADVRMDQLTPTEHHTFCPYKGTASYWTIRVGDKVSENAVWGYPEPYDEVAQIQDFVAFYWDRVDGWFEEDEEIFVHPRDPYKRIDAIAYPGLTANFDAGKTAGDYVKPALYLNEEMRLEEALRRMQRGGQRLGIVLGRDQRELGIISLQDVLKFVFGELSL